MPLDKTKKTINGGGSVPSTAIDDVFCLNQLIVGIMPIGNRSLFGSVQCTPKVIESIRDSPQSHPIYFNIFNTTSDTGDENA